MNFYTKICIAYFACMPLLTQAQQQTEYPNDYLSPAFHAGRRTAVKAQMPKNSVAIFFASQTRNRSNDVDFIYAQNKNFYYLTGLVEPNSMLLLYKEPVTILGKTGTEFLFVQPRNPSREMWTGKILGAEGAKTQLHFEHVFTNDQYKFNTLELTQIDSVMTSFYTENVIPKYFGRGGADALSRMAQLVDSAITTAKKPNAARTIGTIVRNLRAVKQSEEIVLIEKAVIMSTEGHNAVMKAIKPGMTEYQAQAIMEYYFKKNGSEYAGYPSINGSAENSCVLHYETNTRLMKSGDLLLSDCAAEYHGYSADVTRTIPVNGKFSPEQKLIYELVLAAQDSAMAACKPGVASSETQRIALRVIAKGLVQLGIIASETDARKYFPHGTSHGMGLDVHDPNPPTMVPGAVFTIEPGIYIPSNSNCDKKWWGIGVRIEDDILITENGYKNLSAASPRTVAEVEKMVKEKSIFDKK